MPDGGQQLHIYDVLILYLIATCIGVAYSMYKEQVNPLRYGSDCTIL